MISLTVESKRQNKRTNKTHGYRELRGGYGWGQGERRVKGVRKHITSSCDVKKQLGHGDVVCSTVTVVNGRRPRPRGRGLVPVCGLLGSQPAEQGVSGGQGSEPVPDAKKVGDRCQRYCCAHLKAAKRVDLE